MGYIERKLDFSDRWYPSSALWRYVYMFIPTVLGIFLIIFIMVDERIDYLGLSSDDSTLGRALLYLFVGLMGTMIVLLSLVAVSFVRFAMSTKGMVLREFGVSAESAESIIVGMFDEDTLDVRRDDRSQGSAWRRWPDMIAVNWVRSRNTGVRVAIVNFGKHSKTAVLLGPLDVAHKGVVGRMQLVLESALLASDGSTAGQSASRLEAINPDGDAQYEEKVAPSYTDSPRIRI